MGRRRRYRSLGRYCHCRRPVPVYGQFCDRCRKPLLPQVIC